MCGLKIQEQSIDNSQINVSLSKSETTPVISQRAAEREGQTAAVGDGDSTHAQTDQRSRDFVPQYVMSTLMCSRVLAGRETQHMPAQPERSMLPMYVSLKDVDARNSSLDLRDQFWSEHCRPSFQEKLRDLDMVKQGSAMLAFEANVVYPSMVHYYNASLFAMREPCAPPPGLEMLPPRIDTVTSTCVPKVAASAKRRRFKKATVGNYVGIRNKNCSRDECQVTSRKTGECYQICHCRVTEVLPNGYVRVHYIDHERVDESFLWSDIQKNDKEERWCEHGRICNHMVRSGKCDKHHDDLGCKRRFCHNLACADNERSVR